MQENEQLVLNDTSETIKQVEEITEAVDTTVSETSLPDKMSDLRMMLDNLSEEVDSWREWHKNDYPAVIQTLKSQVEEVQNEWNNFNIPQPHWRANFHNIFRRKNVLCVEFTVYEERIFPLPIRLRVLSRQDSNPLE